LSRDIECPAVFGDPALLIQHLWTDSELDVARGTRGLLVLPNFHDFRALRHSSSTVVSPQTREPWHVIRAIAESSMVVGSSLHGVVIAEAFGVPARFVRSSTEPEFKYRDYLEGTGRHDYEFAETVEHAVAMGGAPGLDWDHRPLLDAFPSDLWN
jgi:pyruvyltransferase